MNILSFGILQLRAENTAQDILRKFEEYWTAPLQGIGAEPTQPLEQVEQPPQGVTNADLSSPTG
jgi:hypothetical protein